MAEGLKRRFRAPVVPIVFTESRRPGSMSVIGILQQQPLLDTSRVPRYLISSTCPESLLIGRLLCEGREGNEELPDSLKIRFGDPDELQANSASRRTVGDLTIRPGLGLSDPDTYFYLG